MSAISCKHGMYDDQVCVACATDPLEAEVTSLRAALKQTMEAITGVIESGEIIHDEDADSRFCPGCAVDRALEVARKALGEKP